jgi:two-component system sensor histidine kinase UhpB
MLSRKHAEGEAWYRAVFDQAAVGIARVAPDGSFLEVNDRFCEIVGYARERLMQGDFQQITHPDDLETDLASVARLVAGAATSYAMEKRYLRPDGTIVWAALHVALVRDADGLPSNFVSVVKDISETKQAEQMLKEYAVRLETVSRQLISVQEEERRALARELHDQIGQQLAGLKLNLEALRVRHPALKVERRFTDSLELIDQTMAQIGDTALDLRPAMLDDLGLAAALRSYARRQQERSGCAVTVHGAMEQRLPDHVETAAFRIVQEAVRNAIRHGRATHVSVSIALDADGLAVNVSDDGIGFNQVATPTSDSHPGGTGLLNMRERAELLGGIFELRSSIGAGTSIRACLPVPSARTIG